MDKIREDILAFFGNTKNRALIYSLFIVISLIAVGAAVLVITSNRNTQVLSRDQKKEILDEIVKNNPSNILDETINNQQGTFTPPDVPQLATPSETPDLTKYNYRKTEYSVKNGPAFGACSTNRYYGDGGYSLQPYLGGNYKVTTVEYFEQNRSLYKNYVESNDKSLFHYMLSEYSNTKSETYDYRGGEYAILAQYEAYPGYTREEYASYPVSYNNYFESNDYYTFLGEEKINGKDTYKIQSSYYTFCNGDYGYLVTEENAKDPNVVKIVTISYADKITFNILRSKTYLDVESDANLVSQTDSSYQTSLVKSTDVAFEFKFNYNVNVKPIDYKGYWNLQNPDIIKSNTKNYLASSNLSLLTDDSYIINTISVPNAYPKLANSDYIVDRKFYPNTDVGQKYYEYITSSDYLPAEASIYLYRTVSYQGSKYLTINIYEQGVTTAEVIANATRGAHSSLTFTDTQTVINGESVPVKKITSKNKYFYIPESYTASYPVSYPTTEWESISYVFEFDGRVYLIIADQAFEDVKLRSFKSIVPEELDSFYKLILGYNYYFPTSYASYPLSYPGYSY